MSLTRKGRQRKRCRPLFKTPRLKLHPLFILVGVWYCFTGELPLFLMSCLIALQHECAHAFAAAKLGYKLNSIVLMPFGAVLDGDLKGLSLKDEITVAAWGPLCNLLTAAFFAALWWFFPDTYAFTDTAYFSSLSIALVNLLPAYPLDGGRIFRCILAKALSKIKPLSQAERLAERICRGVTLVFAVALVSAFAALIFRGVANFTLLTFGCFLFFGGIGNRNKAAVYARMDFSAKEAIGRGVELKRVAVLASCPVKDVLRYIARGSYLVLEVYDGEENHLFDLPQNELSAFFLAAPSPYTPVGDVKNALKTSKSMQKSYKMC